MLKFGRETAPSIGRLMADIIGLIRLGARPRSLSASTMSGVLRLTSLRACRETMA
jgi:hypothetical protein